MVFNVPFFICETNYALNYQQQDCLDLDYGVGMTLRAWMQSSSIIGIAMYVLQLLIIGWKILLPLYRKCTLAVTIVNIAIFLLKFLGFNILGFVLYTNID